MVRFISLPAMTADERIARYNTLLVLPYHTIYTCTMPLDLTVPYQICHCQLYHTIQYHAISYLAINHAIPCHIVPYRTIPYTMPYQPYHVIVLYHTISNHTMLYHSILYCTMLYHTISNHTMIYHTIPNYNMPCHSLQPSFIKIKQFIYLQTSFLYLILELQMILL